MMKMAILIVWLAAAGSVRADTPNPKYEAALRRVGKKCSHLDDGQVKQVRELAKKMHNEGATRTAAKKACKALVAEWPTDFKTCATAIVAVAYVPKVLVEEPPFVTGLSPKAEQAVLVGAAELQKQIEIRDLVRARLLKQGGSLALNKYLAERAKAGDLYLGSLRLRPGSVGVLRYPRSGVKVMQVMDSLNMLVEWHGQTVWFEGLSTDGFVDGLLYKMGEVFEYVGTKRFSTVYGGTSTVPLIRHVNLTDVDREKLNVPKIQPIGRSPVRGSFRQVDPTRTYIP